MIKWLRERLATRAALLADLETARLEVARLESANVAQAETIIGRDDVIASYREAHEALRATARAAYSENMVIANSLTDPLAARVGADNGTGGGR